MRWILLLVACASPRPAATTPPAPQARLPFIEDDYARALKEARANKRPLFVEAWAPW